MPSGLDVQRHVRVLLRERHQIVLNELPAKTRRRKIKRKLVIIPTDSVGKSTKLTPLSLSQTLNFI